MHEIMKGMNPETVYVAGPLFDEGERWWIEQIEQTITQIGFNTFLRIATTPKRLPKLCKQFLKTIVMQSVHQISSSQTLMESPPMMEQRGNSDMQQPCKNLL